MFAYISFVNLKPHPTELINQMCIHNQLCIIAKNLYVSEIFFLPLQINAYTHVDHVCKILAL